MNLRHSVRFVAFILILFNLAGCSSDGANNTATGISEVSSPFNRLFTVSKWRVNSFRTSDQVFFGSESVRPTTLTFNSESQIVDIDADCTERSGSYDITGDLISLQANFTRLNTCAVSSGVHNLEIRTLDQMLLDTMSLEEQGESLILRGSEGRELELSPFVEIDDDCCILSLIDSGSFSQLDMPLETNLPTQQIFSSEDMFLSFTNSFASALNFERILSEIDFNQSMAIVVIGELRGVPSYFVEIVEFDEREQDIRSTVQTVELDCETFATVLSTNYKIYRAPKSTKPVIFENISLFTDEFCR